MNDSIVSLDRLNDAQRDEATTILMEALAHAPSAWHDRAAARQETDSFVGKPERLGFAFLEEGIPLGWIGAIRHYPQSWELHPLVIRPGRQREGIGSRLLTALETQAEAEGAVALWLGTDDDFGGTNLYGRDLYPDVLGALASLASTTGHPFTFYRSCGFTVTGVIPDANGPGKHDIIMAKRIGSSAPNET